MSVSRAACKEITADIEAAIAEVLRKHDLKVESVRSGYGDAYSIKITADSKDAPSTFAKFAPMLGLDPSLDGRTFRYGMEHYTISGIAPKSWKRPVLATASSGKTYKFPVDAIKAARFVLP